MEKLLKMKEEDKRLKNKVADIVADVLNLGKRKRMTFNELINISEKENLPYMGLLVLLEKEEFSFSSER